MRGAIEREVGKVFLGFDGFARFSSKFGDLRAHRGKGRVGNCAQQLAFLWSAHLLTHSVLPQAIPVSAGALEESRFARFWTLRTYASSLAARSHRAACCVSMLSISER